ncbi:PH domain-containing protein [Candidatus Pacearchaeota archaeon]|nr:PH domain-containing protein [Candidatus Pacearchaeota archaeon]
MDKKDGDVLRVRVSRKVYLPVYFMIFVLVSTAAYMKYSGREINPLAFNLMIIFSIFGIIATELHRISNVYEINNNSLVHVKGILFKTTRRTDLLAISDAELKQNPWQQLLNFGNVDAIVFSRDSTTYIKNIDNPPVFLDFLEEKINKKRIPTGKRRRNE